MRQPIHTVHWTTILLLTLVFALSGCLENAEKQAETEAQERLVAELQASLARTERTLADREQDIKKLQEQVAAYTVEENHRIDIFRELNEELQGKLGTLEAKVAEYEAEIARLKDMDEYRYAELMELVAAEDWAAAADGLAAFIESYPNSNLVFPARRHHMRAATLAGKPVDRGAAEERMQSEQRNRSAMLTRIDQGEATLAEMEKLLAGKSRGEVRRMLGPPDSTSNGNATWTYTRLVFDADENRNADLVLHFDSQDNVEHILKHASR